MSIYASAAASKTKPNKPNSNPFLHHMRQKQTQFKPNLKADAPETNPICRIGRFFIVFTRGIQYNNDGKIMVYLRYSAKYRR